VAMMRRVTTPLRCGLVIRSGDLDFSCFFGILFARIDWLMVRGAIGVAWKDRDWRRMEEKGLGFSGRGLMHDAQTSEVRARARNAGNICRCREQRQRLMLNVVVC